MNTTKKLIILLLALVLPVTAFALPPYNYTNYEFEVDGIYYILEGDEACVTFQKYESGMHLSDYHNDVIIPPQVTYQGVTYPVTIIDYYAFNYCIGLTSITIPESITTIRDNAFWLCTGLTRVNITNIEAWCKIMMGNSNPLVYAHHLYVNGTEVTELVIPDGITAISNYAFCCCEGLTSLTIPSSVRTIGTNAFENCYGIKEIICKAMTPPTVGAICFDGVSATLFVPSEAMGAYQADRVWGRFNIQPITNQSGDVNGDGEVTVADANNVIDIVVMGGNSGHTRAPAADVNDDGEVNIADVNAIIDIILSTK